MTPTRIACIDIGSNTTRLLVADRDAGGLTEVAALKVFTSLGSGRAPGEPLHDQRITATVTAVGEYLADARRLGARRVDVVATSAVRSAPNGGSVADAVYAAHGVDVRILDGRQEAAYAFAGATVALDADRVGPDTLLGVVDVGGGSTELVLGTLAGGPSWSASLTIGSARLPPCRDPPCAQDLDVLRGLARAAFGAVRPPGVPALALAVGGSATSISRLVGARLSGPSLDVALREICTAPVAQIARRHRMDERRVALLPAGLILLGAASRTLGAPLRVAAGGLREGVLLGEHPARAVGRRPSDSGPSRHLHVESAPPDLPSTQP